MVENDKELITPPADVPEIQRGSWFPLSDTDMIVKYLIDQHWDQPSPPKYWQVSRLSHAAYLYREISTHWTVVAKFYTIKKGSEAEKYAIREFEIIQNAQSNGLGKGEIRSIRPLDVWRGVLFLEYIDGLTLEDMIAVRRSRPGTLLPGIELASKLLAKLHQGGVQKSNKVDFESRIDYFGRILDNLTKYGVLQENPIVSNGLRRSIDRWGSNQEMRNFTPVRIHGDATTSNFIFPWQGGVVAIDWERSKYADPASDLGRMMAEISHSVDQHGGSVAEAQPFVEYVFQTYKEAMPAGWDADSIEERSRFYQALSTLRIARNGWVSRLDRTALVAQTFALLT
jgi:tRNA A-37 threonylcarbamoyl transferase component Bud32